MGLERLPLSPAGTFHASQEFDGSGIPCPSSEPPFSLLLTPYLPPVHVDCSLQLWLNCQC